MGDTEHFDHRQAIRDIEHTIARLQPPKTLLLVDDDPNDIELTLKLLNQFNVTVTTASSGIVARELQVKNKYDLVLFDMIMPGLDGLGFAMASAGLHPGTRFILVTGYPTSPKIEAVLRLGAVMLAKPLTRESLEIIIPLKVES